MGLPFSGKKDQPATPPVTQPPTSAPEKEEKKVGSGRGRKSNFAGKRIYFKVKENPYRKDSARFKNYALIKEGMVYEEYLKQDGDSFNLKFGVDKGHYDVR